MPAADTFGGWLLFGPFTPALLLARGVFTGRTSCASWQRGEPRPIARPPNAPPRPCVHASRARRAMPNSAPRASARSALHASAWRWSVCWSCRGTSRAPRRNPPWPCPGSSLMPTLAWEVEAQRPPAAPWKARSRSPAWSSGHRTPRREPCGSPRAHTPLPAKRPTDPATSCFVPVNWSAWWAWSELRRSHHLRLERDGSHVNHPCAHDRETPVKSPRVGPLQPARRHLRLCSHASITGPRTTFVQRSYPFSLMCRPSLSNSDGSGVPSAISVGVTVSR